ncbi:MAG: alpha-L-fucosidase [Haliea sp.]|nr:alpha-L-fucosidase [Haliea sp.]
MKCYSRAALAHRLVIAITMVFTAACTDPVSEETLARSREMPQWYEDAKLGIFIHWGRLPCRHLPSARLCNRGNLRKLCLATLRARNCHMWSGT